jgi:hypothetical protein
VGCTALGCGPVALGVCRRMRAWRRRAVPVLVRAEAWGGGGAGRGGAERGGGES